MNEQGKRGPGRPRKSEKRQHIDITLSQQTLDLIDSVTDNRSRLIEAAVLSYLKTQYDKASSE